VSANTAATLASVRPTSEMRIVFFPPILSSRNPMATAPIPAVAFSASPQTITSVIVNPNVPAA